jgi:hypothetical protein
VCSQFLLVFAVLAGAGLALYRSDAAALPAPPATGVQAATRRRAHIAGGFAVLFLLFVGQQGLWSIVMQSASARGFALGPIVWTICAAKLLGATAVLRGNIGEAKAPTGVDLAISGGLVAAGGLLMGVAPVIGVYIAGLVIWEVALNVLSARYQALLAFANPRAAGMWITASIFLGAASGHAVAPALAASGYFAAFMAFAVLSAAAPAAWAQRASRARTVEPSADVADA